MRCITYRAGYVIPVLIVVSFVLYALATADELLGIARLGFYIAAFVGVVWALIALVRQARQLEHPTLFFVALFWLFIALGMILVALLFAGVRNFFPDIPLVPEFIVLGLLGSACISVFSVGFVLGWAGRRGMLSERMKAGPLALLFRRRP